MREHYYNRVISHRVDPVAVYGAYRRSQIDRSYMSTLCELLLPFAASVGTSVARHLHEDDRDDIISDLAVIVWSTVPHLLDKEFPTGVSILSYLSRRLRPEAVSRVGIGFSEVVETGLDEDIMAGEVMTPYAQATQRDQKQWVKNYVIRHIRFTGSIRRQCIQLVTKGRYTLRGVVDPDVEKFLIDYVAVLIRVGYREYADA